MARHSKWHNIKVRKGAQDKIRSKAFTIHAKLIAIAAQRGGDPEKNPHLAEAIYNAKKANVPSDNIDRAVKKGSGADKDGIQILEILYEGYAPGGIAVIAKALTDNRNRTAPNMRHAFSKNGGNLGETGSVSNFAFTYRGMILLNNPKNLEALEEIILGSEAEDYEIGEEETRVLTDPKQLASVAKTLENAGFPVESKSFEFLPNDRTSVTEFDKALKVYKLLEELEEDEDIETVWHNADFSDELIEQIELELERTRFRT